MTVGAGEGDVDGAVAGTDGDDVGGEADGVAAGVGRDATEDGAVDDRSRLLSELDSHDLALAMDLVDAGDADALAFDADADPADTFPQSVASGGPTPTGAILWTRVAPGRFDPEVPLGVVVATDPEFAEVVYDGVVNLEEVTDRYRGRS